MSGMPPCRIGTRIAADAQEHVAAPCCWAMVFEGLVDPRSGWALMGDPDE